MTSSQQPPRLKSSPERSPGFRALLQAAEQDGAGAEQLDRLKARLPLGPAGPGSSGPSPAGSPHAAPAGSAMGWKAAAAVVVAAAVSGGGWLAWTTARAVPFRASAPVASSAAYVAAASAFRPPRATPASAESASRDVAASRPSGTSPPSEVALLDAARRSLAKHPDETLRLAREHRRLFPNGMLAQERQVLELEALASLGREAEAQKNAEQFQHDHPDSVYGSRVEKAAPSGAPVDTSHAP